MDWYKRLTERSIRLRGVQGTSVHSRKKRKLESQARYIDSNKKTSFLSVQAIHIMVIIVEERSKIILQNQKRINTLRLIDAHGP